MALTVLEQLLADDGFDLPRGGGAEKSIQCFFPDHDDRTASMSVNVAKGVYNCHGCGKSGNAYKYLTELRRLSPREAMQALEAAGATEAYANTAQRATQEEAKRQSREPRSTKEPYEKAKIGKDLLADRVDLYDYTDTEGGLVFKVGRYELQRDDKDKPDKTFRPFTPKPDGSGYWAVGPKSDQLKPEHRISQYPIWRAPIIAKAVRSWASLPDAAKQQIWLVEGEKCAKLVARLKSPKGYTPLVCSLYGGSKHPIDHHDLSILYGQEVLLLGDADKNGRDYMKRIGKHLTENAATVRYLLPAGEDHYDVGDAAADGWDALMAFVKKTGVVDHATVFKIENDDTTDSVPANALADTPFFRILGFEGQHIVIQSKKTHKIIKKSPASIGSSGNLIELAPLDFWRARVGGKDLSAQRRDVQADAMIRAAEEKGEISTQGTHMWGRGAHRTKAGEVVYNVGTGILSADRTGALTELQPLTVDVGTSEEIYLPGPHIELHDDPQAPNYAGELFDAVMAYRWERDEHAHAFLGWLVTSLVGGALPFRPMVWLTALPSTGKTFLLQQVLNPFFGNLVSDWASVTEAGMALQTADTSLPAYIDEFEPEPGKERRMDDILALMRASTSGGASRTRATAKGEFYQWRVRFSLLMASVDRPRLNEANATRITPIRLSTKGVDDWPAVRDGLLATVEPERSIAIRTHIIRNTVRIAQHAHEIEDALLTEGATTRDAQIRGALSAGVAFLSADDGFRLGQRAPTLSDDYAPFVGLMSTFVRTRYGEDTTVAEALRFGYFLVDGQFVVDNMADEDQRKSRELALRHGFRFADDDTLYCAIDWPAMRDLLKGTPHANIDLDEYLLRLPLAHRPINDAGNHVRIRFAGMVKRVIALPRDTLRRMGLFVF